MAASTKSRRSHQGQIVLSNGWEIGKNFGHIKHGLVQTSPATQSKTEDIVLAAMNRASLGAMSASKAYVRCHVAGNAA